MHNLTPEDFELFIKHVFECAGFDVEYVAELRYPVGPGVDLNLYQPNSGGKRVLKARVEVRGYAPNNFITLQAVREYVGTLHLAGGFMVFSLPQATFNRTLIPQRVIRVALSVLSMANISCAISRTSAVQCT
jgi:hypothetical protein